MMRLVKEVISDVSLDCKSSYSTELAPKASRNSVKRHLGPPW